MPGTIQSQASRSLTDVLADDGEEVALVLVRNPSPRTTGIDLLDQARLPPRSRSRRAVAVQLVGASDLSAEAIRFNVGSGAHSTVTSRSPAGSPSEVFHAAV